MTVLQNLRLTYPEGSDSIHKLRLAKSRRVFGEVETASYGRLQVEHDPASNDLAIHGVHILLDDVAPALRSAFISASANFLQAENDEAQVAARTTIGLIVSAILNHDKTAKEKVRERTLNARSGT